MIPLIKHYDDLLHDNKSFCVNVTADWLLNVIVVSCGQIIINSIFISIYKTLIQTLTHKDIYMKTHILTHKDPITV